MKKIDGVVFDFDDTLYEYEAKNKNCLETIFKEIGSQFQIDYDKILANYNKIRRECAGTSTNHNKLVYFMKLFETLELSLNDAIIYHDRYRDLFYRSIKLYEGCSQFIQSIYSNGIKIFILTNNTIENTIEKLKYLGIIQYIEKIICSHVEGYEKPHPKVYKIVLETLNRYNICNPVFIGDNYQNDIKPFMDQGFTVFHKWSHNCIENYQFSSYDSLLERFSVQLYCD